MSDKNKDLFDFANRTITKNVTDTSNNSTTLSAVNVKGELLVGNGSGPSQLDPNTGVSSDCLIKDNTQPLGVKWGQPTVLPDIAPCITTGITVLNLTPAENGSTIIYSAAAGIINLPISPPNGTTYNINSTTENVLTRLLSPSSSIRSGCDVFATGVSITNSVRFSVVYNLSTAQWVAFVNKGVLVPYVP